MFNYLLKCLNLFLLIQSAISENIFFGKNIVASQSKENNHYSKNYLNDGVTYNMFLTGHIQKESSEFLYYKFSNNYLINYITINWINLNSNYNIYISNNCHIENTDFKFYNISDLFKTKNTSLLHQNNNSNNNIILNNFDKSCSEWSNIYSESFTYNINSFIQGISNFFKRIDSCLDNKCNNASKYYGNRI